MEKVASPRAGTMATASGRVQFLGTLGGGRRERKAARAKEKEKENTILGRLTPFLRRAGVLPLETGAAACAKDSTSLVVIRASPVRSRNLLELSD